jgi:hypothetical protein
MLRANIDRTQQISRSCRLWKVFVIHLYHVNDTLNDPLK